MNHRRAAIAVGLLAAVVIGCARPSAGSDGTPGRPDGVIEVPGAEGPPSADAIPSVHLDGDAIVLRGHGGERVVYRLDEQDGTAVHAVVRPGGQGPPTVLVLTRVEAGEPPRYELRYLVADEEAPTDLFWFPWRLQVHDEVAAVLDVPPLPVWAPDGEALAWIEWTSRGTRLRTVGWIDDGVARNPSDDVASYPLQDVPPGVQLEAWEAGPGDGVLVGRLDDQLYRIELEHAERDPVRSGPDR